MAWDMLVHQCLGKVSGYKITRVCSISMNGMSRVTLFTAFVPLQCNRLRECFFVVFFGVFVYFGFVTTGCGRLKFCKSALGLGQGLYREDYKLVVHLQNSNATDNQQQCSN